jgi:hypothetical protein
LLRRAHPAEDEHRYQQPANPPTQVTAKL